MLQPELLQECNSNPICLTSLICAALIISQLSQFTAVAREHPYLWRHYSFSTEVEFLLRSSREPICRKSPAARGHSQGWQSALTLPGTRAPYPSISHGISSPPCTAARHHTLRKMSQNSETATELPKPKDALPSKRCCGLLFHNSHGLQWQSQSPGWRSRGWRTSLQCAVTSTLRTTTQTQQGAGTTAQHCTFPLLRTLTW